jgi:hypothetical protein
MTDATMTANTLALETINAAAMSNDNIKQGFMLWSIRASQAYNALTAGMLAIYTAEYIARGLNK